MPVCQGGGGGESETPSTVGVCLSVRGGGESETPSTVGACLSGGGGGGGGIRNT